MKIDNIATTSFDEPEVRTSKEPDSKKSLFTPFENPYRPSTTKGGKGLTAAERNNNPFNIKYGNFAAQFGATKENKAALDGGSFATFPSVDAGMKAAKGLLLGKNYRNLTVDAAMRRWSNNGYGGELVPNLAQKRIADLSPLELDTLQRKQVVREDRNYAKKIGYLKYGGKIRKMATGGTTPKTPKVAGEGFQLDSGLVSTGLGLAGTFVDSFDDNPKKINKTASVGGSALKGAAAGATIGSVIPGWGTAVGAAAGAIIGAGSGLIKNKKRQRLMDQTIQENQRNFNTMIQDRSAYLYGQLNNNNQLKYGGKIRQLADGGKLKNKPMVSSTLSVNKVVKNPNKMLTDNQIQDLEEIELGNIYTKAKYPEVTLNTFKGRAYNANDNIFVDKDLARYDIPAELAHTEQGRKLSDRAFNARLNSDLLKAKGNKEKTYKIPGTIENEAHRIIQPRIQKDYDNYTEELLNLKYTRNKTLANKLGKKKPELNYGGRLRKFAYGGDIYEAERNEVVQGEGVQLEQGKKLGGNLHLVGGKTHEQGGTLGQGGDRVFTNSIYFNGQTPAQVVKKLGLKLKKMEPMLTSNDNMKKKTAERMSSKINEQVEQVYQMQEDFKSQSQYFMYGGAIRKFAAGGDIDADKRRIAAVEKYLKDHPQETADSKRSLQAEVDKLRKRSNTPKYSGAKPWNPLDRGDNLNTFNGKSKLDIPITKDLYVGNNLDEVTVKGKRPVGTGSKLPVKKNSGVASTSASKRAISTPNTISLKGRVNPLAQGLLNRTTDGNLAKLTKPTTATTKSRKGIDVDPSLVTGLGLSAIGYMNSQNNINRMDTSVPVNLTMSPNYGYTDRSRNARQDLSASANTILRDTNVSFAQKQALFSKYSGGINQINAQENNNRADYDQQFNNQVFATNARNNAMLTQAQQERISNENTKLGLKSANMDNFLGNVNTTLAEQDKKKLDKKKFSILSNSYKSRYNTDFDVTI